MDLGTLGNYPLPTRFRDALGVSTAQELADSVGAQGTASPELGKTAESAYNSLRAGDAAPARALLVDSLKVDPKVADETLAKLRSV